MSLDPVVLFFAFGVAARLLKVELRLPEALYEALSIYLLIAIGLKGGIQLAKADWASLLPQVMAALALSALIPLLVYPAIRRLVGLRAVDAASIAAHYGSVSVVTFAVAMTALRSAGLPTEDELAVLVAIMEAPGIMVGILLARKFASAQSLESAVGPNPTATALDTRRARGSGTMIDWRGLLHEAFFGKAVFLLLGGLLIGYMVGENGAKPIAPLYQDFFKGALTLFMLELGLIAGGQLRDLKKAGFRLVIFGLVTPCLLASLGLAVAFALNLNASEATIFATLAASASYIAAPAAMRIAVPQANPALSIGLALGVTFPWNVLIGIPLYMHFAQKMTS